MPKLLVYETYHDILIAKTFASLHAPARKLQRQPHYPPVGDQRWFQSYLSSTEFIIQDVLEFFSIPLKLASITVHRVVCALHKTPHCPPVGVQRWFQSYLSSTEFIIQDVLEFFSIPLKLASITVHRVVCALHRTQSPAKDLSLDP